MATYCVHCSDEKNSGFMKKNGPKPAHIHKPTLVNDCPATVLDVRCLIKTNLSNTSIFDDEQYPPPTQAIVMNIFSFKHIPEL